MEESTMVLWLALALRDRHDATVYEPLPKRGSISFTNSTSANVAKRKRERPTRPRPPD